VIPINLELEAELAPIGAARHPTRRPRTGDS
jgi:hypothetical protein